ncbi:MAG: DUF928 domain-containing protein, partial [Sphaerospermopsis sp. SIO1G2]|nr:DUF928 domain-containing protein [Sphaerospermopsis sp. SIO1G2]
MITQKNFINNSLLKIIAGLFPTLIIASTLSLPSLAQTTTNNSVKTESNLNIKTRKNTQTQRVIKFPVSPNRGQPKRSVAGGRRGITCLVTNNEKSSLIAIMPTWENEGKTVQDTSSLYVFVPENNTKIAEFVLIDEDGNEAYLKNFVPPNKPGIVQIDIPASANLKVGKNYQWYFTLICDP